MAQDFGSPEDGKEAAMKLDIFNHIFPKKYFERMLKVAPNGRDMHKRVRAIPSIVDLDARFRIMDRFGDYAQVICLGSPPIEAFGPAPVSTEMAALANDGMAELVRKHPKRFPAFVASLPMNDPAGLLKEAQRAIKQLGAVGVQVFSNVNGRPLTAPGTLPLFDLMAKLDLPIWLHPARTPMRPDYVDEDRSQYAMWQIFGWPFETSMAMTRLIFSGVLDRHPKLKIITHHAGAMIPYFDKRIEYVYPLFQSLGQMGNALDRLQKPLIEYYRMFYNDTAVMGSVGGMHAAYAFFGADKLLFGTDTPFDTKGGSLFTSETVFSIEALAIPPAEKAAIYAGNLKRLLKL